MASAWTGAEGRHPPRLAHRIQHLPEAGACEASFAEYPSALRLRCLTLPVVFLAAVEEESCETRRFRRPVYADQFDRHRDVARDRHHKGVDTIYWRSFIRAPTLHGG